MTGRIGVDRGAPRSMYTKQIRKAKMNSKKESRQEVYTRGGRKRTGGRLE